MKNIDNIIRNNRELFDTADPDEGHFNRFAKKLKQQNRKNHSLTSYPFLLKAASIAILVTLSFLWTYDNLIKPSSKNSGTTLSEVSDEYMEVEVYYKQQVNLMYGQIRDLNVFSDTIQKTILLEELSDMDSIYTNLQGELESNPKDKRIINAMIKHYQLKVDVMNQILYQLEQIKNENLINRKNHESNQI